MSVNGVSFVAQMSSVQAGAQTSGMVDHACQKSWGLDWIDFPVWDSNEPRLWIPSSLVEERKTLTLGARRNLSWSRRSEPRQVTCLSWSAKGSWVWEGHMEGNPPQCPLNLSTSIRTCSRRVEVERIIRLFKSLGHALKHMSLEKAMMHHIHQGWPSNGAPHREAFPSGLSLQIPRFLGPYKYRGSTPFGLLFGLFSLRSFSFLLCAFVVAVCASGHPLPSRWHPQACF